MDINAAQAASLISPRETDRITLGTKPDDGLKADFESTLGKAIHKVADLQRAAEHANSEFASGKNGQLHENMIALEKANIGLKMMVSVRNRVLEAYRDLMHMS